MKKSNQNNAVKNLICHIKVMYYNNDPMLSNVDDVNILYNALCDLDDIIGMYEVKDSIVKQIKFLLVNCANSNSNDKSKFENHMLHTVVFGPPGVGKTTIGSCLANIWKGLGLIDKKKASPKESQRNSKGIRILPIPIFLIKEREKECNKENNKELDDSPDSKSDNNLGSRDLEDETKAFENSVKSYLNNFDSNIGNDDNDYNQYNSDNKYSLLNYSKKKKSDRHNRPTTTHSNGGFSSDLKDSVNNAKHINKADDCRSYVVGLSQSQKDIRDQNLLKFCIKNLTKSSEQTKSKPLLKREKIEAPIKIVSRPDFVGQYVGHTCDKTQKLLTSTLEEGKVLFIDEAYSIVLDEKDSFGHEALNELNRFMSEYPELVVIFAGYKNKMEDTLFRYQPGFKRRCTWVFEISNYTGEMLTAIFKKQLGKEGWIYSGADEELNSFFSKKMKHFDSFGGDTIRMALYCKLKYSEMKFDYNISDTLENKTITFKIFKIAYEDLYCKNKPESNDLSEYLRYSMYV